METSSWFVGAKFTLLGDEREVEPARMRLCENSFFEMIRKKSEKKTTEDTENTEKGNLELLPTRKTPILFDKSYFQLVTEHLHERLLLLLASVFSVISVVILFFHLKSARFIDESEFSHSLIRAVFGQERKWRRGVLRCEPKVSP